MILLSCSGLTRGFDAGPLFEGVGFELYSHERVGFVGPNGAGKTTLMRILAGLDRPDDGEVRLHAGARAALLEQHPDFPPGRTLFGEAKSALNELISAQEDLIHTAERLAASKPARALFGDTFVEHHAATRQWEEREFRKAITDWELARYFEII